MVGEREESSWAVLCSFPRCLLTLGTASSAATSTNYSYVCWIDMNWIRYALDSGCFLLGSPSVSSNIGPLPIQSERRRHLKQDLSIISDLGRSMMNSVPTREDSLVECSGTLLPSCTSTLQCISPVFRRSVVGSSSTFYPFVSELCGRISPLNHGSMRGHQFVKILPEQLSEALLLFVMCWANQHIFHRNGSSER